MTSMRDWTKVRRGTNPGRMGRPLKNALGVRNVEVMLRVNAAEKEWLNSEQQEGESLADTVRRLLAPYADGVLFVDSGDRT